MHPQWFFEEVVTANIRDLEARPDDMRAVINAVLTIDALVGLLHAHLTALGRPEVAHLKDEQYREQLGRDCPGYAVLRDTAAALKHGKLDHRRKNRPDRLVRTPDRIQSTELVIDLFGIDDEIGGFGAILCLEPGPDAVRVDDAIAATCLMLLPLLDTLSNPKATPLP